MESVNPIDAQRKLLEIQQENAAKEAMAQKAIEKQGEDNVFYSLRAVGLASDVYDTSAAIQANIIAKNQFVNAIPHSSNVLYADAEKAEFDTVILVINTKKNTTLSEVRGIFAEGIKATKNEGIINYAGASYSECSKATSGNIRKNYIFKDLVLQFFNLIRSEEHKKRMENNVGTIFSHAARNFTQKHQDFTQFKKVRTPVVLENL